MHGLKNHARDREIVTDHFSGHLPLEVILAVQHWNAHLLFWEFPF